MDSTNDCAFAALESGSGRHGDVFIASSQRAGRGTRGRQWTSRPGGLYLSAILESPQMPPPGLWTVSGALACHDLAEDVGVLARLDWPNDLVSTSEEKIAGVLAESRGLSESGPAIFVLGVGINVAEAVNESQLDRERPVASLAELGGSMTLDETLEQLLVRLGERVDQALQRPGSVYGAFFDRCQQSGRDVIVDVAGHEVEGRFEGLAGDGSLRLISREGTAKTFSIAHVRSLRTGRAVEERLNPGS
ncbi:MAG: biotin--[acetyl-CoA-carboxylase] ligase [Planctomycetota bacterium]